MITIFPSKLCGSVTAPPSKSCSHRALICAALSDRPVILEGLSNCDDVMLTLRCLEALGAHYENGIMTPIDKCSLPSTPTLCCGESGSTLRFLLPIVAALGCGAEFHLGKRLSERPIFELCDELCRHGADIKIHGSSLVISGKICSGAYCLPGNISSQYISGLLFALPLVGGGEVNITSVLKSSEYIHITTDYLNHSNIYVNRIGNTFKVSGEYSFKSPHRIEGDWSAAAYWLCAAAAKGNDISVCGLSERTYQGDSSILSELRKMDATVCADERITVHADELFGIQFDASSSPDLVPPIAVLCALNHGESRIYNAAALRTKESDRLKALEVMLTSMGIDATTSDDELIIRGGTLHGAKLCSFSDHRIAMAAILLASLADSPSTLDDADCIAKSYPDFLNDFISLGGQIS